MHHAVRIRGHAIGFAAHTDRRFVCIHGTAAVTYAQRNTVQLVLIFIRDIDLKIYIRANLYAAAAVLINADACACGRFHQQIITVIDALCADRDIALQVRQIHGAAAVVSRYAVCVCTDKYRIGVRGAVRGLSVRFKGQRVDGIAPICRKGYCVIAPFFHNVLGNLTVDATPGMDCNQHFVTVRLALSGF